MYSTGQIIPKWGMKVKKEAQVAERREDESIAGNVGLPMMVQS